MKRIITFMLVLCLVVDPFLFSISNKAWASDNPMADAVAFIFLVPITLLVVMGGVALVQTAILNLAGIERHEQSEFVNYEGWIMASVTSSSDAQPGDHVYIVKEGPLYRKTPPPEDSVSWLVKNLNCEVLERRIIKDHSIFYQSYNGVWLKVRTQEVDRFKYPRDYKGLKKPVI
ncbi:hypothetical protein ACFL4J_00190 [Candidatus Margulisiibacteriota bacterium]